MKFRGSAGDVIIQNKIDVFHRGVGPLRFIINLNFRKRSLTKGSMEE